MKITLMLIAHWILNVALKLACLWCVLLGIFGNIAGPDAIFNRVMLEIVGAAFGALAFFFTRYTINKG